MENYKLAAKYSFMPNRLKYCGPEGADKLLHDFVVNGSNFGLVKAMLMEFHALKLYLNLIAKNNNKKPFDKEVIEAYWIGNELIENVKTEEIKSLILDDFTKKGLPGSIAQKLAGKIPKNVVPHHSFHVFHIHSITGKLHPTIGNIDKCRISSGKVKEIKNGSLIVSYKPIIFDGKIKFGELKEKEIEFNKNFIKNLRTNDYVSMHWDFAVDKITKEHVEALEKYTKRNMDAVNSL